MVSHAPLCALLVCVNWNISCESMLPHCSFRLSSSSHLKKFRGSKKDDEVRPTSTQKRSHCVFIATPFSSQTPPALNSQHFWSVKVCIFPVSVTPLFSPSFCLLYVLAYRVHGSAVIMFQMTRKRRRKRREARMRRESGNCTTLMMKRSV